VARVTRIVSCTMFLAVFFGPIFLATGSQESRPPNSASDYSQEPFILESDVTKVVFENDGSYSHDNIGRIRI